MDRMLVRRELPPDTDAVHDVHARAFATAYPDAEPIEPKLTDDLRRTDAWIPQLSLVAVRDDVVVGHVCCTRAHLLPDERPVLGLGPIGVEPRLQRAGVGAALMHAVIGAADALDEPLIVLVGHPTYYPRFGFVPAALLGITPPEPSWQEAFMGRTLTAYEATMTGEFRFAEPFRDL
jgi:putative acetyltransferase